MKITSIHQGSAMWGGTATADGKKFKWYYRHRSLFDMTEEEGSIPNCWINIDPPQAPRKPS
jgi:hypothetical protein